MKTVWEVLIVITFASLITLGLSQMGDFIFEEQALSIQSVETLSTYSAQADAFLLEYQTNLNRSEVDPFLETDLNDVEGFVQEYRDYKGRLDQLKDGLLLVYKLPDLAFSLIPGVQSDDLGPYIDAYRFIIWVLLLLLLIVGLKNGSLFPQF